MMCPLVVEKLFHLFGQGLFHVFMADEVQGIQSRRIISKLKSCINVHDSPGLVIFLRLFLFLPGMFCCFVFEKL